LCRRFPTSSRTHPFLARVSERLTAGLAPLAPLGLSLPACARPARHNPGFGLRLGRPAGFPPGSRSPPRLDALAAATLPNFLPIPSACGTFKVPLWAGIHRGSLVPSSCTASTSRFLLVPLTMLNCLAYWPPSLGLYCGRRFLPVPQLVLSSATQVFSRHHGSRLEACPLLGALSLPSQPIRSRGSLPLALLLATLCWKVLAVSPRHVSTTFLWGPSLRSAFSC